MKPLQVLREKAGLTQVQLASKMKVSEITIQNWESGRRTPRVKRIRELAKFLKCEPAALL